MAIKGVTWIEQHFEKIVLGAVGATALGILGWQFVGRQSTILVNGQAVPLDQANNQLAAKAREVQGKIKAVDPKLPEKFPVTAIADDFVKRHAAPVAPSQRLAWEPRPLATLDPIFKGGGVAGDGAQRGPTNPLVVPVPSTPVAEAYIETLLRPQIDDKIKITGTPTEADLVDVPFVTVAVAFPGDKLQQALTLDPEGPTVPMPEHWWSGSMALLGIELEREEMLPSGEWGNPTLVKTSKFGMSVLDQAREDGVTVGSLHDLAKLANEQPDTIRRPRPPQAYIGEDWMPPGEVGRANPDMAEQARLRKEIEAADKRLEKIDEQLKRLANDQKTESQRKNFESQKRPIIAARNEAADKLSKLMAPPAPAPQQQYVDPRMTNKTVITEPLLATPNIQVWAHDTDVQRNKAYRYRVRAVVTNPAYGQGAGLTPDQQDLAKDPLARSEPTEWTQAVRVDPELYYFITSADSEKNNALNSMPVATAEVFSFSLGYWREDTVRMHPGDPLAAQIEVPPLEAIRIAAAGNNNNGGNDVPAPREGRRGGEGSTPPGSSTPTTGGSGRGGGKSATGGAPAGGGDRRPPTPPREQPKPIEPAPKAGEAAKAAPAVKNRILPVVVPVYLLDVAAAPATEGTQDRHQAFLRADDGSIEIRVPEEDRVRKVYQRVKASAEAAGLATIHKVNLDQMKQPNKPEKEEPKGGSGGG
jgi:hypothetical protein